ncbi:MAG: TrkH family potassium uptake protein [Rhodospirillales bacterium]|nr:TrkH family potassium uptake protein [Rhodospirillales bacterium]
MTPPAVDGAGGGRRPSRPRPVEFAPIAFFTGVVVLAGGVTMILPALIDAFYGHQDYKVFLACCAINIFFGSAMLASGRGFKTAMNLREVMITVPITWCVVAVFASLPFMFSEFQMSFTDAYFEVISGLTTTGSTVMVGLDSAPKGLLLWRFLLHWFGGFGVITFALFVLPFLRIGGMQLFAIDLAAQSGRFAPRMTSVIGRVGLVYLGITVACALCFGLAGMDTFDAIGHAMSTVATGGFSSHDASLGFFNSPAINVIAIVFMLISGMPFLLHIEMARGHFGAWFNDSQVRLFYAIVALSSLSIAAWLIVDRDMPVGEAVLHATFNVTTIITTTGFVISDFSLWGAFPLVVLLLLMLAGGCTGATTGGIKMFRLVVLAANVALQVKRQIYPHVSAALIYNREPVPELIRGSVTNYFFVFMTTFVILAILMGAAGLNFEESLSAAASALGNVGPGFGPRIGPCCTFATISDAAKWLMIFGMLAGRLEILILFIPFAPVFWRN